MQTIIGLNLTLCSTQKQKHLMLGILQSLRRVFRYYLRRVSEQTANFTLWLDVKNLNTQNEAATLQQLLQLDSIFRLNDKVVVESGNAKLLTSFHNAGFFTSYYLPPLHYYNSITDYSKAVAAKLTQNHCSAISQHIDYYPIMHRYFSAYPKLLWDTSAAIYNPLARRATQLILQSDSSVRTTRFNER